MFKGEDTLEKIKKHNITWIIDMRLHAYLRVFNK
jgi:hypothetical protein